MIKALLSGGLFCDNDQTDCTLSLSIYQKFSRLKFSSLHLFLQLNLSYLFYVVVRKESMHSQQ